MRRAPAPSIVHPPRGARRPSAVRCGAALALGALLAALPARIAGAQRAGATSVYLELLGNGGLYSVNLDRRLGAGGMTVRAGIASWTSDGGLFAGVGERQRFLTVPLMLNALTGTGTHHVELGGGVLLGSQTVTPPFGGPTTRSSIVTATSTLGYRRQPPGRGWVFRAGLTPMFGFGSEEQAYPDRGFFVSAGVSAGYAF
jgi:hypothetical protein